MKNQHLFNQHKLINSMGEYGKHLMHYLVQTDHGQTIKIKKSTQINISFTRGNGGRRSFASSFIVSLFFYSSYDLLHARSWLFEASNVRMASWHKILTNELIWSLKLFWMVQFNFKFLKIWNQINLFLKI